MTFPACATSAQHNNRVSHYEQMTNFYIDCLYYGSQSQRMTFIIKLSLTQRHIYKTENTSAYIWCLGNTTKILVVSYSREQRGANTSRKIIHM